MLPLCSSGVMHCAASNSSLLRWKQGGGIVPGFNCVSFACTFKRRHCCCCPQSLQPQGELGTAAAVLVQDSNPCTCMHRNSLSRLVTGRVFALSLVLPYFIVSYRTSGQQKSEPAIKYKGCLRDPCGGAEPAAWGNTGDSGCHQGGVGRERVSHLGKGV